MISLTIAVTTFNREDGLRAALQSILVQLPAGVKVLVLDNHSTKPASEALADLILDNTEKQITVHRNVVNVGVGANFLRGFEVCDTDWIWFLTDKAILRPGAVERVLSAIREHTNCIFMNFEVENSPPSSFPKRSMSIVTTGRRGLIDNILYYGSIIDQMTLVYYVPRVREAVHVGYLYIYSSAPQLAIVLAALRDDDRCFLSSEQVAVRRGTPPAEQWSTLILMQGCMNILNLPLSPSERRILNVKILEFLPNLRHYVAKFLILKTKGDESVTDYCRFYVNLIRFHDSRLLTRLRLFIVPLLMTMPRASLSILEFIAQRLFGRSLHEAAERRA